MRKGFTKKFLGIFLAAAMMVQSVVPVYANEVGDIVATTSMSSAEDGVDEQEDSAQVDEGTAELSLGEDASNEESEDESTEEASVEDAAASETGSEDVSSDESAAIDDPLSDGDTEADYDSSAEDNTAVLTDENDDIVKKGVGVEGNADEKPASVSDADPTNVEIIQMGDGLFGPNYNIDAAVKCARDNYLNSSYGLCAEFVSKCLLAGGLNFPLCKGATTLRKTLLDYGCFTEYKLTESGDCVYANNANAGKISVGDVILYRNETTRNLVIEHAVIVTGINSKNQVLCTSRNASYVDNPWVATYTNGSLSVKSGQMSIWVLHYTGAVGNGASVSFGTPEVTEVTSNSAKVSVIFSNAGTIVSGGVKWGKNDKLLSTPVTSTISNGQNRLTYMLTKLDGARTYYYQFYIIDGAGKEWTSSVSTFSTANDEISEIVITPQIGSFSETVYTQYRNGVEFYLNAKSKADLKLQKYGYLYRMDNGPWIDHCTYDRDVEEKFYCVTNSEINNFVFSEQNDKEIDPCGHFFEVKFYAQVVGGTMHYAQYNFRPERIEPVTQIVTDDKGMDVYISVPDVITESINDINVSLTVFPSLKEWSFKKYDGCGLIFYDEAGEYYHTRINKDELDGADTVRVMASITGVHKLDNTSYFSVSKTINDIVFAPESCTVAFISDDDYKEVQVKYGETVEEPIMHSTEDRYFRGWFTDQSYSELYDFSRPVYEDIYLYARWVDKYGLILNANGGSFSEDHMIEEVCYENRYNSIGIRPEREGYAFTGWYSAPECTREYLVSNTSGNSPSVNSIPPGYGGDSTLYAGWTRDYYTIIFDATSNGVIKDYTDDPNGLQIRTILMPKDSLWPIGGYLSSPWYYENYVDYVGDENKKLSGWVDEKGTSYTSLYSLYPDKDTVFTAQFVGAYNLTFKAGEGTFPNRWSGFSGGSFNSARNEAYIKVKENTYLGSKTYYSSGETVNTYLPPDPISNDSKKIFVGWYTPDGVKLEGSYLNNYRIHSDEVFEARYEANVTITFDAGAGKIGASSKYTCSMLPGNSMSSKGYTLPSDPVRDDNQIFVGWYKDPEFKEKIEKWDILDLIVDEDIILYAKYGKAVLVTFFFNYECVEPETGFVYDSSMRWIAYGDIIGAKAPSVKTHLENASFTGWYRDKECTDGPVNLYEPVTEMMDLYAGYKEDDCYTITFRTGKAGITFTGGESEIEVKVKKGQPLLYNSMVNSSPVISYNDTAKKLSEVPTGFWTTGSDKYFLTSPDYLITTVPQVISGGKTALLPYTGFVPTSDMVLTAEWKKKVVVTFQAPEGCRINSSLPIMRDGKVLFVSGDPYLEFAVAKDGKNYDYTKLYYTTYAGRKLQEFINYAPQISGGSSSYTWGANASGKALNTATVVNANTAVYGLKSSASGGSGSTPLDTIATVTLHAANGQIIDMNKTNYGEAMPLNIRSWSDGMAYGGISVVSNDKNKVFAGWYRDPECTQVYEHTRYQSGYEIISFPDKITDLYAKFDDAYIITFDANGGYFDSSESVHSGNVTDMIVQNVKAAPGKAFNLASLSKRIRHANYKVFDGWYEDSSCTIKAKTELLEYTGEYYTPKSSITLYAKWIDNPDTIPKVSISPANIKLNIGGTGKLSVEASEDATGSYKYYVANYSYGKTNTKYIMPATIDSNGNIHARAEGTVEVYAEVNGVRSTNAIITVSATIDKKVAKIAYVLNGGTNNESNPAYYSEPNSVHLLSPTRNGYDFDGWFTDAKFTKAINDDTFGVVKDVTVYAKWTARICTVYYDANGGHFEGENEDTEEVTTEVTYGGVYPKNYPAVNPRRVGYTFAGWFTDSTDGTRIVPGTTKVNPVNYDSVRVYAHWTPITYTIRFNSNPVTGKNAVKTQKATYNVAVNLMANAFKQAGATFVGWKDESGTIYTDKQSVINLVSGTAANEIIDLYAQWSYVDYVIFFDIGVNLNKLDEINSVQSGTFEIGGSSLPETNEFDLVEAGINMDIATDRYGYLQAMKYGESIELSGKEFVRKGYTLTGWKNSKTGKVVKNGEIKNLTTKSESIMFTAQWKKDSYKITYNMNGGAFTKTATNKPANYSVDDGELPLADESEVVKKGYTFDGWYDNKNFDGERYEYVGASDSGDVLKTLNLYAKWNPFEYDVILDPNGGDVASEVITSSDYEFELKYDESLKLIDHKNVFSRDGYTFDSWNTLENGKGKKFAANAVIKNLLDGTADEDEITLYAIWKPIAYTIKYNFDGGSMPKGKKAPTSYKPGTTTKIDRPKKAGYIFDGWDVDNENVNVEEYPESDHQDCISGDSDSYGNVTLKAKWVANQYTIILHYNRDDSEDVVEMPGYYESSKLYEVNDFVNEVKNEWQNAGKIKSFNTKPNGKGINYPVGSWLSRLSEPDKDGNNEVLHLYAQWGDKVLFTIKYNLNGGTLNKPVEAFDRTKDVAIPDPVKPGYVFKGWRIGYEESEFYEYGEKETRLVAWKNTTTTTDDKGILLVKKLQLIKGCNVNIILSAVYTEATYSVTIDPNASDAKLVNTFTDANNKTYAAGSVFKKAAIGKYSYESRAELPELERKGYEFKGLFTNKNGTGEPVTDTNELTTGSSVVLYAVWSPDEYKIEYSADDDIWGEANKAVNKAATGKYGQKIVIKKPAVTGYTFKGWKLKDAYVDEDGIEYNNPDKISVTKDKKTGFVTAINPANDGNVALEAEWFENSYTVIVNVNGGKAASKDSPKQYTIGREYATYTYDLSGILNAAGTAIKKGSHTKKGFVYAGIAADAKGKTVVMDKDGYLKGKYAEVGTSKLTAKDGATVTLYAIWEKVTAAQPVVTDVSLNGEMVSLDLAVPVSAADTSYEVQVSTSITFRDSVTKSSTVTAENFEIDRETGAVSMIVDAYKGGTTNYVRIRQIKIDSEGNEIPGKWSNRVAAY